MYFSVSPKIKPIAKQPAVLMANVPKGKFEDGAISEIEFRCNSGAPNQ